jgi:hypothetical protein
MNDEKPECDSPPICGSVEAGTWTILGDARAVAAMNTEMLAMLKELEWSYEDAPRTCCPVCYSERRHGHDESCRLAALLAKAEGRSK